MSSKLALPIAALCAALTALVVLGACVVLLAFSVVSSGAGSAQPPAPTRAQRGAAGRRGGAGARGGPAGLLVPAPGGAPSAFARADIPPAYLALYLAAAARFGLDWTILAGIGRVECDHGRDPAPACTVEGQFNSAGAGGPAQFLLSTWQRYGVSATGSGAPDMWNPADAIFSMANYLRACGAPANYPQAIYGYNHAWWYVADVLSWARRYRGRTVRLDVRPLSPATTGQEAAADPGPVGQPVAAACRCGGLLPSRGASISRPAGASSARPSVAGATITLSGSVAFCSQIGGRAP